MLHDDGRSDNDIRKKFRKRRAGRFLPLLTLLVGLLRLLVDVYFHEH